MWRRIKQTTYLVSWRNLHTSNVYFATREQLTQCYSVLNLSENCSTEEVRESYLRLAKQYHPDSGSPTADPLSFTQVKDAYKTLLNHREKTQKDAQEEKDFVEEPDFESKFRVPAPQHRQYLNNEGVGFGSPSMRTKQFNQYKLDKASEAAAQYKADQASVLYETRVATKERQSAQKMKTRNSMDRLVEDLIAQSMAKGEFEDLPGTGKPLDYDTRHNPMLDSSTNNLNKILIQNGYIPDWIRLLKEIRESISTARQKLLDVRIQLGENHSIESLSKNILWTESVSDFRKSVGEINKSVANFNLMVPWVWKQRMPYNEEKEIKRVTDLYEEKLRNGEFFAENVAEIEHEANMMDKSSKNSEDEPTSQVKALYHQFKAIFTMS